MKFYPLIVFGLGLSALIFTATDTRIRRGLFYFLWISAIVCMAGSIFFYESITLFDQDLKHFPIYEIILLIGYFFLIMSFMLSVFLTKADVYSQLADERQQRAISEITQLAASSNSLIELLNFSLDKIVGMLHMNAGTVHIFHAARQKLILGSYKGLTPWLARRLETINFFSSFSSISIAIFLIFSPLLNQLSK